MVDGTKGSLWEATAVPATAWPALKGELSADVAIVGGGYTGCAAALAAAGAGASVVLLESHDIGRGASGLTGGQVIPGLKYDPDELEAMFGAELGPRLVAAIGGVGDEVFGLIERHRIDCEATRKGWLQPAISARTLEMVKRRCDQWARRGAPANFVDRSRLGELIGTDQYLGGWEDRRAGHVQPLSFNRGLAAAAGRAGARIFVRSPARQLAKDGSRWLLRSDGIEPARLPERPTQLIPVAFPDLSCLTIVGAPPGQR